MQLCGTKCTPVGISKLKCGHKLLEGEKPRSDTEGPPKMAQYASAAMMMGRNQEWAASQSGQQYLANSYQMAAAAGAAHPAAQQVI